MLEFLSFNLTFSAEMSLLEFETKKDKNFSKKPKSTIFGSFSFVDNADVVHVLKLKSAGNSNFEKMKNFVKSKNDEKTQEFDVKKCEINCA